MILPIMYEFSVELTYPINESISGSILTFFCNFAIILYLQADPEHRQNSYGNLIYIISLTIFIISLIFTKEKKYTQRKDNNIVWIKLLYL